MGLINRIEFRIFQLKWRKKNQHNQTVPVCMFFSQLVSVGKGTYGGLCVLTHNENAKLSIGHYCSIAPEAAFILSADHYLNHISTYPFLVKVLGNKLEGVSKGDILIEDDVWIGYRATILSGVHIGQGAIVAAGAVVTNNVPPYAIVGGVPAKVIKYRFEPEMIKELIKIDYGKLDKEQIDKHIEDLYVKLDTKEQIAWMPQK